MASKNGDNRQEKQLTEDSEFAPNLKKKQSCTKLRQISCIMNKGREAKLTMYRFPLKIIKMQPVSKNRTKMFAEPHQVMQTD